MRPHPATGSQMGFVSRIGATLWCSLAVAISSANAAPGGRESALDARWTAQSDLAFRHLAAPEMRYASAMVQDGQGFLWLGTQSGLVRWDGYRSRVYHFDPDVTGALPDNYILSLHTDDRGRLWVGTSAGGLARYDPERDNFVVLGAGSRGLSNPSVWAIAADGSQGLWIGTGAGLEHVDLAAGTVRNVDLGDGYHVAVKSVVQEQDGTLWLGTENGLLRRSPGGAQFVPVPLHTSQHFTPSIAVLYLDRAGRLWIGALSYGAFVLEPGQSVPRPVHESGVSSRLEGDSVRAIAEALNGDIWIGTNGDGIVVLDAADGRRTRRLRYQPAISSSLQDDDIHSLYRDPGGLMWASSTMALNMYDMRPSGISTLFGAAGGDKPITAVQVPFVLANDERRIWLSVGDGARSGIDILDPLAGRIAQLRADPRHPTGALPPGRVLAMVATADGTVYIGTRLGLYRADAHGRHVTRVEVAQRAADAAVWSLCVDRGVLWMGGMDGLWALDTRDRRALRVLRHEPAERLGSQRVTVILPGAGNVLWVGTSASLNRVDRASDEIKRLLVDPKDPGGFLGGYIVSLLIDTRGRLWVASVGNGIQIMEGPDGVDRPRFQRLGIRQGLPDSGVNKLLQDRQGTIWASTDNGLAAIDPVSFAVRVFGEPQGVAIMEYWSNAGAETAAGELLFGGQGGLTVVRPDRVGLRHYRPRVVVTEAFVGGKSVSASSLNSTVTPARLLIEADDPSLMVEFAALDYAAPEDNQYSYRLAGFDKTWIKTPATRRLASYTNLPPGHYTLQLRGSNNQDSLAPDELTVSVNVMPAWYQTTLFKIAIGLLAGLLLGAIMQLRTRLLRARQRELQDLVAQRTAELEQRERELQQSKLRLEEIAYLDPLTGLANRRLFDKDLDHLTALSLRGGGAFTLLLIDLDRFKQINDTLGHDAGDALLVEVARRLRAEVRQNDRISRLGGDEFAILLADSAAADEIERVCRRIVDSLAQPMIYMNQTVLPAASLGAACFPAHAMDHDALYKCADLALYDAKSGGRSTWRLYKPAASAEPRSTEPVTGNRTP